MHAAFAPPTKLINCAFPTFICFDLWTYFVKGQYDCHDRWNDPFHSRDWSFTGFSNRPRRSYKDTLHARANGIPEIRIDKKATVWQVRMAARKHSKKRLFVFNDLMSVHRYHVFRQWILIRHACVHNKRNILETNMGERSWSGIDLQPLHPWRIVWMRYRLFLLKFFGPQRFTLHIDATCFPCYFDWRWSLIGASTGFQEIPGGRPLRLQAKCRGLQRSRVRIVSFASVYAAVSKIRVVCKQNGTKAGQVVSLEWHARYHCVTGARFWASSIQSWSGRVLELAMLSRRQLKSFYIMPTSINFRKFVHTLNLNHHFCIQVRPMPCMKTKMDRWPTFCHQMPSQWWMAGLWFAFAAVAFAQTPPNFIAMIVPTLNIRKTSYSMNCLDKVIGLCSIATWLEQRKTCVCVCVWGVWMCEHAKHNLNSLLYSTAQDWTSGGVQCESWWYLLKSQQRNIKRHNWIPMAVKY